MHLLNQYLLNIAWYVVESGDRVVNKIDRME